MAQHDGDEALDALGGALGAEVKRLRGGKGLAQDHHCLHVGILEGLAGRKKEPLGWIARVCVRNALCSEYKKGMAICLGDTGAATQLLAFQSNSRLFFTAHNVYVYTQRILLLTRLLK